MTRGRTGNAVLTTDTDSTDNIGSMRLEYAQSAAVSVAADDSGSSEFDRPMFPHPAFSYPWYLCYPWSKSIQALEEMHNLGDEHSPRDSI